MSQRHPGYTPNPERYNPSFWEEEYAMLSRPGTREMQGALFLRRPKQRLILPRWKHVHIKRHYLAIKEFSAHDAAPRQVDYFSTHVIPADTCLFRVWFGPFRHLAARFGQPINERRYYQD